jgi:hypothetical protein
MFAGWSPKWAPALYHHWGALVSQFLSTADAVGLIIFALQRFVEQGVLHGPEFDS